MVDARIKQRLWSLSRLEKERELTSMTPVILREPGHLVREQQWNAFCQCTGDLPTQLDARLVARPCELI